MELSQGIAAGLVAGVVMGAFSELGFRCHVFRSSLLTIDGSFLLERLKVRDAPVLMYVTGAVLHLLTSAIFGLVYAIGSYFLGVDPSSVLTVSIYVVLLWVAMLFCALPMAGAGFMGRKLNRNTWVEQLALHIVFGASFWSMW